MRLSQLYRQGMCDTVKSREEDFACTTVQAVQYSSGIALPLRVPRGIASRPFPPVLSNATRALISPNLTDKPKFRAATIRSPVPGVVHVGFPPSLLVNRI